MWSTTPPPTSPAVAWTSSRLCVEDSTIPCPKRNSTSPLPTNCTPCPPATSTRWCSTPWCSISPVPNTWRRSWRMCCREWRPAVGSSLGTCAACPSPKGCTPRWLSIGRRTDDSPTVLRRRAAGIFIEEDELLLHPNFFHALARRLPRPARVEILTKEAPQSGELGAYRFQAVLHLDDHPWPSLPALLWRREGLHPGGPATPPAADEWPPRPRIHSQPQAPPRPTPARRPARPQRTPERCRVAESSGGSCPTKGSSP